MINVTSRRIGGEGHYIGRGTPLGNPFALPKGAEKGSTLNDYRRWLWDQVLNRKEALEELQLLADKVRSGEEVTLVCWCKKEANDDTPCHGDLVKAAVEWLLCFDAPPKVEGRPRDESGRFIKLDPGEMDPRD